MICIDKSMKRGINMKYLVTILEKTTEEQLREIERLGMKIEYKSVLLPLLVIDNVDMSALNSLSFVKGIEPNYTGSLATIRGVAITPHLDFNLIQPYFNYATTKVAVIDSGIDNNKTFNIENSIDYTNTNINSVKHGTKVSHIINQVVPGIKLLSAKVTNNMNVETDKVIKALEWAYVNGARVINMSMGMVTTDLQGRIVRCKGTCALCKMVEALSQEGVLVVTAAGNDGPKVGTIRCPGNSPYSIAVGLVNYNKHLDDISSRGRIGQLKPDLLTSGYIYVKEGKSSELEQGSSFAAPIITGIAAGIYQRYCNINRVKELIISCTEKLGHAYNEEGNGLLKIEKLEEVFNLEKAVSDN